ncbi:hypothetical protein QU522_09960 [Klebsiella pneumoniae subsp. pneumoniae]|nr:hypothetical protein [Klebsiella pneumoniae]WKA68933.1 hypothetical protein QU522_09960 [Klebsiella pneumoniae subsp. pneumoniae]
MQCDTAAELAALQAQTRRIRQVRYRPSRLDRYTGELLSLYQAGASAFPGLLQGFFQRQLLFLQDGSALIQCLPLFFQLLSGFFPGILHRLKQEAFFLRKRFPQYILSTTVVASQGRCLQIVILNKGILSGSVSLFCLPQCLLISAYLALYPAGL